MGGLSWNSYIKKHWSEVKKTTPKSELPKFNTWVKTQKEAYHKQKKKNSNVKVVKAVTEKVKNPKTKIPDVKKSEKTIIPRNERRELTYTPAVAKHIFKSFSDALDIPEMFNARVVNSIEYKKYLESKNFFNVGYNKKFAEVCYQYANTYSRDIISDDPLFHLPLYLNNKMLRMGDIRKIVSREDSKVLVDFTISYFGGRNVYFKDPPGVNFDFAVLVNNLNPIKSIIKIGMTLTNTANRSGMLVKTNQIIGNTITEFWKNTSVDDVQPIFNTLNINQFDFNSMINMLQGSGEVRIRQQNIKTLDEAEEEAAERPIYFKMNDMDDIENGDFVFHRTGWCGVVEQKTRKTIHVVNPTTNKLTMYNKIDPFTVLEPINKEEYENEGIDDRKMFKLKDIGYTGSRMDLQRHYFKKMKVELNIQVDINAEPLRDTREDLIKLYQVFNLSSIRNLGGVYYLQFNS